MRRALARATGPIRDLSPESAIGILTLGLVLGTFPVYGCPTALCLLAVACFRLNAPALHAINQLSAPLQFALLVPFARIGAAILGVPVHDSGALLSRAGNFTAQALAGWSVTAVPSGLVVYLVLIVALRRNRCRAVFE
ncbi:MAG: DUF2062 domain-containing protein [Candidatus Solibacter sp.]